ncbi:hypothetical protein [Halocatena halophila]|uniref:hypothetical protein n=1 Tax=Halocatena halophila TaxID=2814576 RepID=UPI002ED5DA6D
MNIYLDATTLIALGTVGSLNLLETFNGTPVVVPAVQSEISTEPAETNCHRFFESETVVQTMPAEESHVSRAQSILDTTVVIGDVQLLACVLFHIGHDESVAVVSDDRRVRTVTEGLGATITGTIGVLVRAVEEGYDHDQALDLLQRLDANGLHMTGELRVTARRLIIEAAEACRSE